MPAQWMYYYLLDGDWASNALSWQWVAGCNARKKYISNQDNINQYFYTKQKRTFLDRDYAELGRIPIPDSLKEICVPDLTSNLPMSEQPTIDRQLPTLIYNYYNLDPQWITEQQANRILLLEPSLFKQYPVAAGDIDFILQLSRNIPGIQVFTGEFEALYKLTSPGSIIYKEHTLNRHYKGAVDARDWMFKFEGYYPSFFAFWKRCKKEMKIG